jgi:PKD repeat protein
MGKYSLIFLCLVLFATSSEAVTIEASRTSSCVAPCSVFMRDSDVVASTPTDQYFHTRQYSWDFGDTGAGTWSDGTSRNIDQGPAAAHVYDTAGTYTVTLTVVESNGTAVGSDTQTIAVTDPDTVFSGTATTCVSTGSDFTGCPSGAATVTTSSLAGLSGYTNAGERVLLRRGDSWTVSADIGFGVNTGPVSIGAFGTCTTPDARGICSNAPAITVTYVDGFIQFGANRDWRIADLTFTAAKTVASIYQGGQDLRNILLYKVKSTGFNNPVGVTHWRSSDAQYNDGLSLVSSLISDFGTNGTYIGGERISLLGNTIQNSDISHIVRVWQAYWGVINHNTLSGSSLTNANGRHALKLHGSTPYGLPNGETYVGTFAQTGGSGLRNHTEMVVISGNTIGSSGYWPVSVGPQNAGLDERNSDILFEKNRVVAQYGEQSSTLVQEAVLFEGRYNTIRNNVIDGTGGSADFTGIQVWRRGVEWTPLNNSIYNNTIYSATNHSSSGTGIEVGTDAENTIVRNNYVSFPNLTSTETLLTNTGTNTTSSNNVLTDTAYFVDPTNATPLSRNFALTASSTAAINQGYTTPLVDDYLGNCRAGVTYDVGAYEYGASPCDAEVETVTAILTGGTIRGGAVVHP